MGIPDLNFVIDTLLDHVQVPEGMMLGPETKLEDIGVTRMVIARIKNDLLNTMHLPYEDDATEFDKFFEHGLNHDWRNTYPEANFGAPQTVQRLHHVIHRGYEYTLEKSSSVYKAA